MATKVGANTKKAREMTKDLFNRLSDRFPGYWEMDRETWPNFLDLGAKRGMVRQPRIISVTHDFPYPDRGYRALCANIEDGSLNRYFKNFDELCEFIQVNIL